MEARSIPTTGSPADRSTLPMPPRGGGDCGRRRPLRSALGGPPCSRGRQARRDRRSIPGPGGRPGPLPPGFCIDTRNWKASDRRDDGGSFIASTRGLRGCCCRPHRRRLRLSDRRDGRPEGSPVLPGAGARGAVDADRDDRRPHRPRPGPPDPEEGRSRRPAGPDPLRVAGDFGKAVVAGGRPGDRSHPSDQGPSHPRSVTPSSAIGPTRGGPIP